MPRRAAPARPPRSACPIATALELLGDRWTLLVVRDLLFSRRARFGELLTSPEAIPTNLLTERLRRLERAGLITRTLYQRRPRRYEYRLTAAGADLLPTLRELIAWANRHLPGTAVPPPALLLAPPGMPAPPASAEKSARRQR
jgi:DNA-binding HxlR family transcriptional regulator